MQSSRLVPLAADFFVRQKTMANTFIIGGRQFSLESLEPQIDREFVALYAAFLSSSAYQLDSLLAVAHCYFSTPSTTTHNHGQFFNNFTILWQNALSAGHFDEAERIWLMACNIAWSWERNNPGKLIHKGTPYYFWGMTAILRGDIDRGYALMHQALEEDVRVTGLEFPDTPALAMATMNAEKFEQAARDWVERKASIAKEYLSNYRSATGKGLDFGGFNARYLQHPPSRYAVYSLSYVFGRLTKLASAPKKILASEFAAQLYMDLVFRVLQVIESTLKAKNPSGKTFFYQAEFLASKAGLSLGQKDLSHINSESTKDFEKTLCDLLDGTFTLPGGSQAGGLNRDLAVAYSCRNYGAHQLVPVPAALNRYQEIYQAIFNTLFLIVETLY